jgi:hypothetical protein
MTDPVDVGARPASTSAGAKRCCCRSASITLSALALSATTEGDSWPSLLLGAIESLHDATTASQPASDNTTTAFFFIVMKLPPRHALTYTTYLRRFATMPATQI